MGTEKKNAFILKKKKVAFILKEKMHSVTNGSIAFNKLSLAVFNNILEILAGNIRMINKWFQSERNESIFYHFKGLFKKKIQMFL